MIIVAAPRTITPTVANRLVRLRGIQTVNIGTIVASQHKDDRNIGEAGARLAEGDAVIVIVTVCG